MEHGDTITLCCAIPFFNHQESAVWRQEQRLPVDVVVRGDVCGAGVGLRSESFDGVKGFGVEGWIWGRRWRHGTGGPLNLGDHGVQEGKMVASREKEEGGERKGEREDDEEGVEDGFALHGLAYHRCLCLKPKYSDGGEEDNCKPWLVRMKYGKETIARRSDGAWCTNNEPSRAFDRAYLSRRSHLL